MSDGSRGFIEETTYGGGTKTPIAVVVSQSKHLAVALEDANNGNSCVWSTLDPMYTQYNKSAKTEDDAKDLVTLCNGYSETWDASASVDNTTVKGTSTNFPAFKAAGDYTPTLPSSVHLTGKMVGKKWHLPSAGEWMVAYSALGFAKLSDVTTYSGNINGLYSSWYTTLADVAFTQVGARSWASGFSPSKYYHSSSELTETYYPHRAVIQTFFPQNHAYRWWFNYHNSWDGYVRAFINYDE